MEKNDGLAQELTEAGAEAGRLVPALAQRLAEWHEYGYHVVLASMNRHRAERLARLLETRAWTWKSIPTPTWEPGRRVDITAGELPGASGCSRQAHRPHRRRGPGVPARRPAPQGNRPPQDLTSLADLQEGDFVVHLDHGIGIYRGLVKLTVGTEVNDFLELEYQSGDRLYLPVDRLNLVQKYLGVEGAGPRVDRLGGKTLGKGQERVKKAVEKIARELVELYALRRVLPGHHFSPPDPAYREFEATFEYEETPDQLQAIHDVLADMASEKPMDRLICGDVGYGKTEVAVRAAFKAAMDGKQVAMLVPTTVLAEQHYDTFSRRLAHYPVEVRVLSRFKSPAEQKHILAELAQGKVDIIIGTHRLLSKDVAFRDLGLVIVDEEQRFGVKQKERLKEWRRTVDVLTLTATPIPRTLQLSLTGLRELSLINTPPEDRRAIRTYLCRPEKAVIQAAIRRELARGGQVFFVHNRVRNLATWARYVQEMVPEARVAMAHGQMPNGSWKRSWCASGAGKWMCWCAPPSSKPASTSPRPTPSSSTGPTPWGWPSSTSSGAGWAAARPRPMPICWCPDEAALSSEAQKRLKALMEFTELGSRLQDRHARPADPGRRQPPGPGPVRPGGGGGLRALSATAGGGHPGVQRASPEDLAPEPEIRLPLAAYLPEDYVPDVKQRLALYRRLSGRLTPEMVRELEEEFLDRFGPLPQEGRNLLEVVRPKHRLRQLGIKRLEVQDSFARSAVCRAGAPGPAAAHWPAEEASRRLFASPRIKPCRCACR